MARVSLQPNSAQVTTHIMPYHMNINGCQCGEAATDPKSYVVSLAESCRWVSQIQEIGEFGGVRHSSVCQDYVPQHFSAFCCLNLLTLHTLVAPFCHETCIHYTIHTSLYTIIILQCLHV